MPPCAVFNRRDAKVSLSNPGKKEEKRKKERKNEREVGVEDKEAGDGM